jgi:hypothetical protein
MVQVGRCNGFVEVRLIRPHTQRDNASHRSFDAVGMPPIGAQTDSASHALKISCITMHPTIQGDRRRPWVSRDCSPSC